MNSLALLLSLLAAPAAEPEEPSATYLLSLALPVSAEARTDGFKLGTWAVDVLSVCRIPAGWRVLAGRSATLDGRLEGEATHGVTWKGDSSEFESLALVRLWGPRRHEEIRTDEVVHPATFAGTVSILDAGGGEKPLHQRQIRLTPATACPPPPLREGEERAGASDSR